MQNGSLWLRMAQWFKNAGRPPQEACESAMPGEALSDGCSAGVESAAVRGGPVRATNVALKHGHDTPRAGRDGLRSVDLAGVVGERGDPDAAQWHEIVAAANRVADSAEGLQKAGDRQAALLADIKDVVSAANAEGRRLQEHLASLPRVADAQREALVSIGRQLDEAQRAGQRVAESLAELHGVLLRMGDTLAASSRTLEQVGEAMASRQDEVAVRLGEMSRRLVVFGWCAVALCAAAVLLGLAAVLI